MRNFKQTLGMVAVLLATVFLVGCSKKADLEIAKPGSVNLSFTGSTLKADANVEVSALIVTITDAQGKAVYPNERITLYNVNGSYTGKALQLSPGKYSIESFLVVDAKNNVVYLTPKSGSKKANLVKQPLPIWFEIQANVTTSLSPEVVTPDGPAADYGYAQFGFTVVNENPASDSICLRIGTHNKPYFANSSILIYSDASMQKFAYTGGVINVTVPVSKSGYTIFPNGPFIDSIYVSAQDAAQYSCSTNNHIEIFEKPAPITSYFETLSLYVKNSNGSPAPYTVTITKDGSISCSKIQTLVAIIMSAEDRASLDSALRAADVYNIKQSEIQCMIEWGKYDSYSIKGANTSVNYIAQYTGGCGLSAQAKIVDVEVKRLIAKYLGNLDETPVKADYTIKVGETTSISLNSNASTGYSWAWTNKADIKILKATSNYSQLSVDRKGAPGVEEWSFTGLQAGTATVILEYQRSFEANSSIEKKVFTVQVLAE